VPSIEAKIRVTVPDHIGVLLAFDIDEFGSHPSNQNVSIHTTLQTERYYTGILKCSL
jgi:hypothetical protein